METIGRLYEWLRVGPTPDTEWVIDAAMVHAEPEWFERLSELLVERASDHAWAALISHYRRLSPAARSTVHADAKRFQHGLALAARATRVEARLSAMIALELRPVTSLMYLASAALLDGDARIRQMAGRALLRGARDTLTLLRETPRPHDAALEKTRRDMARACEEAIRGFEIHRRSDVLRACLCFAPDIGEMLWHRLGNVRARLTIVLREHLEQWADGNMAWFLLQALRRSAWRPLAARILASWTNPAELHGLLRESALLNDEELIDQFTSIHSPAWFRKVDRQLTKLEPGLRCHAPWWVYRAGYVEDEKLSLLSHWVRSRDPLLQEASVEALGRLRHPQALQVLRAVPSAPPHVAARIRQLLENQDEVRELRTRPPRRVPLLTHARESARPAPPAEAASPPTPTITPVPDPAQPPAPAPAPAASASAETEDLASQASTAIFDQLQEAARAADDELRQAIIDLLRRNAGAWRNELGRLLAEPDPRQRVLGLQVVGTAALAGTFRPQLDQLRHDALASIQLLTDGLCAQLDALTAGGYEPAPPPESRLNVEDLDTLEALDRDLVRLCGGDPQALAPVTEKVAALYGLAPSESTPPSKPTAPAQPHAPAPAAAAPPAEAGPETLPDDAYDGEFI